MVSRGAIEALASGIILVALGGAGVLAWQNGFWGTVLGVALASAWLVMRSARPAKLPAAVMLRSSGANADADALRLRLLLDQVPIPLIEVQAETVRALNRAARTLFVADDRILPVPAALARSDSRQMVHQGRRFRIERVDVTGGVVAALIDVDAEERTAEARATAEMIQVLGHEMLNGLAPIVSLAESGLAAIEAPARGGKLLPEILVTLARRAESLLRFTEAYRAMARLPDPIGALVDMKQLASELAYLFASHWAEAVILHVDVGEDAPAQIDRDQMTQAIWALLQNGAEAAIAAGGAARVDLSIQHRAGMLLIDVSDTGDGVAIEHASRIFRPFFTTKADGTGVGLSLARQIALAHGGELTLTAADRGAFRLSVPAGISRTTSSL